MTTYWEPDKECLDREELEQLQLERLQATLNRVYAHVPFYRSGFDRIGMSPGDVRALSDLSLLPFTTKEDLRDNYPYGHFAVPMQDVVRIHTSSGTTGDFTAVGYTRNDIKTWGGLMARVLTAGGVTKDDVVQIAHAYGLSTGGFGHHHGAERIGASVIPAAGASVARQIKIMKDFRTTAFVSAPSVALQLVAGIREKGIPVSSLSLRVGMFGEEPWSERIRAEIEEGLGVKATDNYGLSEIIGPGVAAECAERNGMHLHEDHFLVEVVDPATLEPVPPGQVGELVLTTLTKEAFPMIRYRTRDLTSLLPGDCPCGRTGARMTRVMGRTDDMVIIRGVNVFPSQVEAVLLAIWGTVPDFRLVIEREQGADVVTVLVGGLDLLTPDQTELEAEQLVQRRLCEELSVSATVQLVSLQTLAACEGKPRRVIDKRTL